MADTQFGADDHGLSFDGYRVNRSRLKVTLLHHEVRKPVLRGEVATEVRLDSEIGRSHDIEILEGHVRPDDVHLLVPSHVAPSVSCRRQGGDVALSPPRSPKAAGGVLGTAPLGPWLLRVQQRERDGRSDCAIHSAPRCSAPRTTTASESASSEPACAAMATL